MTEAAVEIAWAWDVGEHRRFAIESEVSAPSPVWFYASQNAEARVVAWDLTLVADCAPVRELGRRGWEIACLVEDVGLLAAPMPGDQRDRTGRGMLSDILPELDERLTGATVGFVLRRDGRTSLFGVEGLPRRWRREGLMAENVRVVLERAFVGLDLPLPPGGVADGGVWAHTRNEMFRAPSLVGTVGSAEVVNHAVVRDGRVDVASAGRGVGEVGEQAIVLQFSYDGAAVFDTGGLVERTWSVAGTPTPSSAGNMGTSAPGYYQYGHLVRLGASEVRDVGPTLEMAAPAGRGPLNTSTSSGLGRELPP